MDISRRHVYARIYKKNAAPQMEHPDLTPALGPTVRTPQCGRAVGEIQQCHSVPGFHQHFSSCAEDAFFATTFDGLLRQGLQSLQSLIPATILPSQ